ncbi:GDP-mannose 4,6-dehydratase [Fimbriiglobus ruber]|uniref:UDP-glucose 4-epimerase n=1 Tax=Fimbriiglobus ruber TaxID=1908690 RepID=A0A225E9J2_9BACT|nr:GDP-mannose 4,6-dehydratase [Fimbriiglobus ruber]OWK46716.1 UDP-glucose 4-epimerase [Fimbriiglobus ruber]
MRILITGITGFVGGHLTELLRAEGGHDVHGLSRHGVWGLACAHLSGAATMRAVDLLDRDTIARVVRDVRPDWVFHLAGYANTGKSFREPDVCWADNLNGTRAVYDAIAESGVRPRILFVSTGLVYGDPDGPEQAFDESAVLKPASPYAASKAAADLLGYQYTRSPGLDIVRVRLFNQIGPRQPADYAVANFARQIAAAEAGKQSPVIETGDLSAHRDLTDVRDMVTAFRALIEHGAKGEVYNAGRGQTWRIRDVLDKLVGLARVRVEVRQKIEPGRAADTAITRADTRKLRRVTGWAPRYELDRTLADTLDYWRGVAAQG